MNNASSPSHAHLIEQHVADMRLRDRIRALQELRLDMRIMQCEVAVDQAFARAGYSPTAAAPCEVQRP